MRDIIYDVKSWLKQQSAVALATVISTWGSAPRGVGAKMAMTSSGKISGSVSGGCIEGAVFEIGVETLDSGRPRLVHFGITDETAWGVGLACGGSLELFVERADPVLLNRISDLIEKGRPFALVTVIDSPDKWHGSKILVLGEGLVEGEVDPVLFEPMEEAALRALVAGDPFRQKLDLVSEKGTAVEVFAEAILPPPTLVIIGGVHIAIALNAIARVAGFRTIIIDPRRAFGSTERFSQVDSLIQLWPQDALKEIELTSSTAVAVLTHDPKIDDPALIAALSSPAFYIGALGSRSTHTSRKKRLIVAGLSEEQLAKIQAPIGIDINADSPEEIAVSIMAEIIRARRSRAEENLTDAR